MHSKVSDPRAAHTVGRTNATTSIPSPIGPAASSTEVDAVTVTVTSASGSRRLMKWVTAPERRRTSTS